MNIEIGKKWVDALRSGNYLQGQGMLINSRFTEFCCLGVLCDIYLKENGNSGCRWEKDGFIDTNYLFNRWNEFLPETVMEWADIKSNDGMVGGATNLVLMNDNGKTFMEIADVIEREMEYL